MRTFRVAILGASPCDQCPGVNCCRQNGHEFAVLLEADEHARFRPFSIDVAIEHHGNRVVERVLPYVNGRCQFLGDDNLCLIYNDRPMSCRRFECVNYFHNRGATLEEHGRFLQLNLDVLERLKQM